REAAERALRDVLLLDPCHREAQNNLAVLLRQRMRDEDAVFEARGNVLAWVLGERYQAACTTPSDINEHLPTLYELARECKHVTELGARTGLPTLAFLWAQPEKLVCHGPAPFPGLDQLRALAGRTEFLFRLGDAPAEVEETDLLFLDVRGANDELGAALRLQ